MKTFPSIVSASSERAILTPRTEGAEGGQEGDGVRWERRRDVKDFNTIRESLHVSSVSERLRQKLEEGLYGETFRGVRAGHMERKAGF